MPTPDTLPVPAWVWALWRRHRALIAAQVKEYPLPPGAYAELQWLESQLQMWDAMREANE
jgi:hypothetical protein